MKRRINKGKIERIRAGELDYGSKTAPVRWTNSLLLLLLLLLRRRQKFCHLSDSWPFDVASCFNMPTARAHKFAIFRHIKLMIIISLRPDCSSQLESTLLIAVASVCLARWGRYGQWKTAHRDYHWRSGQRKKAGCLNRQWPVCFFSLIWFMYTQYGFWLDLTCKWYRGRCILICAQFFLDDFLIPQSSVCDSCLYTFRPVLIFAFP